MQRKSIRELFESSDFAELMARYATRGSSEVPLDHLKFIQSLIQHPHGPSVGGSAESRWSEGTWLNWIHNRLLELETQPMLTVWERFVKPPKPSPPLVSISEWREFLRAYAELRTHVADAEDWTEPDALLSSPERAPESAVAETEQRLGVRFPTSLRTFYLASDGWPADNWYRPAIKPLCEVNYLEQHEPHLHALAHETEYFERPFKNDPDGSRLQEYRIEQGTRVKRSIALSRKGGDMETILIDPLLPSADDEWPCGSWAHWHPAMQWSWTSFGEYMRARYNSLLQQTE